MRGFAIFAVMAAVLALLSAADAGAAERSRRRFAVICAGAPHDAQHYRWYWGATSGMFDVLEKRYGYAKEDIYFLFCDRHDDDPRVDFVATKANLRGVFKKLAERMRPGDTLFGFFVGHGNRAGSGSDYELTDGRLRDEELDEWRSGIQAKTQTYVFTPCHSGGFARVLGRQSGTIVITSCRVDEVNAAGFAEAVRDALNHAPKADRDGDGRVSIGEAYNFALVAVRKWYQKRGRKLAEHCQIDDNGDGKSSYGPLPTSGHGQSALNRFLDNDRGRGHEGRSLKKKGAALPFDPARSRKRAGAPGESVKPARSLVRYRDNPVLRVGPKGAWNDQTLCCFCVLDLGDRFHLYTGGARYGQKKHIGVATSQDGIHWTWYEKNPLFAGSMPYAIKVGDEIRLYYSGGHAGLPGLQMRTSRDGFRWSEPRKVFRGCADPCVVRVAEDRFHLYFCHGRRKVKQGKRVWEFRIHLATSADGMRWQERPGPILPLGPEGSWEANGHAGPVVLKLPDGLHMWYLGAGRYRGEGAWRIGHATSPDGVQWTKSGTEPVLDIGSPGAWDGGTFMSFDIVLRDGKLLFWYAADPGKHREETKMSIQIGHGTSR